MAAIDYKFGAYDFIAKNNDYEAFEVEWSFRPGAVQIPRRDGVLIQTNPFRTHKTVSLRGSLSTTVNITDMLSQRNTMMAAFSAGRQKLQEFDDRYIFAVCTLVGFSYPPGAGMFSLDWWAEFLADVPFWESTTEQSRTAPFPDIDPGGAAPSLPKFTTTISAGTLTALILERTMPTPAKKLKWTGSQGVGSLIVDMDAMTIKDGTGASKLSGLSTAAGENDFWSLQAGNNVVIVTATGGTTSTAMTWRARWD